MGEVVRRRHLEIWISEPLAAAWEAADPKRTWPRRVERSGALILNHEDRLGQLQRGAIAEVVLANVLKWMSALADAVEDDVANGAALARIIRGNITQAEAMKESFAAYDRLVGGTPVDEAG